MIADRRNNYELVSADTHLDTVVLAGTVGTVGRGVQVIITAISDHLLITDT